MEEPPPRRAKILAVVREGYVGIKVSLTTDRLRYIIQRFLRKLKRKRNRETNTKTEDL